MKSLKVALAITLSLLALDAQAMRFLRTNTAVIVSVGPFYDRTDGVTPETALTITNERITLVAETDAGSAPTLVLDNITGATSGTANDLNYITGQDNGMMQLELAAADVNRLGRMFLTITDAANHVPVFHEFEVVPALVYDTYFASSGGATFPAATLASTTNITAATGVDITKILGTSISTPATAGILDVNVKNINNTAAATPGASGGVLISGTNSGTTTLGALTVTGAYTQTGAVTYSGLVSYDDGIDIAVATTNRDAVLAVGNGSGDALDLRGGNAVTTTAAGQGVRVAGGTASTSSGGVAGVAASFTGGAGAASTNGAAKGVTMAGGGTNTVASTATALDLVATSNGHGLKALGTGSGAGVYGQGGSTGDGASFVGGSGSGLYATSSTGSGIWAQGGTDKLGLLVQSAGSLPAMSIENSGTAEALTLYTTAADALGIYPTAGHGINIAADGTSKHGILVTGGTGGTSDGIKAVAGTGGVPIRGDITGNLTGNVSGSVGSVTGNVGGDIVGDISGLKQSALLDFFTTDSSTTYASAIAGSVVKEIADNAGGASLTVADIADGVWDEDMTAHQTQGTAGQVLGDSAADADSIWSLANTNLDATVSSRLAPTTAGRTLDVTATGEAGLDLSNTAGTLDAAEIGADAITSAKVADATIDAATFAAGAIDAAAIAAGAITSSEAPNLDAAVSTATRWYYTGTADSGTTTTFVDAARTEGDADYWAGALVVFTSGTLAGQARYITSFNPATDTFTFSPATTQAVGTHTYEIQADGPGFRRTDSCVP